MRRRTRVQLDATGAPLLLPHNLAVFTLEDWPGVSDYDRWANWWQARNLWAMENDAPDEVLDIATAGETAPQMTAEDISRLI